MANLPENQTYIKTSNIPPVPNIKKAVSSFKPRPKTGVGSYASSRANLDEMLATAQDPTANTELPAANIMGTNFLESSWEAPSLPTGTTLSKGENSTVPFSSSGYEVFGGTKPSDQAVLRTIPGTGQYIFDPTQAINTSADRPDEESATWQTLKEQALDGRSNRMFEVDHAIPLWLGGVNTPENLQVLSRPEHADKTKAEAVALTLFANKVINKDEAFALATSWRDRDLSIVPTPSTLKDNYDLGQTKGQISLSEAIKVRDQWKQAETAVPKVKFKDFWNAVKTNPFVYGLRKGLTAGFTKYDPNVKIEDGGDQAALMGGQLLGTVLSVTAIGRGLGMASKALQASSYVNGALKTAGILKATTAAAEAGTKIKVFSPNLYATMDSSLKAAQAGVFKKWLLPVTMYGQLQETTEEDPARIARLAEDLIYGGLTGFYAPNLLGAAKTAATVATVSMMSDVMLGRENVAQNALINGLTIGALHKIGSKSIMEDARFRFDQQNAANANNVLASFIPSIKGKFIDVDNLPAYNPSAKPKPLYSLKELDDLEQEAADTFLSKIRGEDGMGISEEALIAQKDAMDNALFLLRAQATPGGMTNEQAVSKMKELLMAAQKGADGKTQDAFFGGTVSSRASRIANTIPDDLKTSKLQFVGSDQFPTGLIRSVGINGDQLDASGNLIQKGVHNDPEAVVQYINDYNSGKSWKNVLLIEREERAPLIELINKDKDQASTDPNPYKIIQAVGVTPQEDGGLLFTNLGYIPKENKIGVPGTQMDKFALNTQAEIVSDKYAAYSTNLQKDNIYDKLEENNLKWTLANINIANFKGWESNNADITKPFIELELSKLHWDRAIELQKGQGKVTLTLAEDGPKVVLERANKTKNTDEAKELNDEYIANTKESADQMTSLDNPAVAAIETPRNVVEITNRNIARAREALSSPDIPTMVVKMKQLLMVDLNEEEAASLWSSRNEYTRQDLFSLLKTKGNALVQKTIVDPAREVTKSLENNPEFDKRRIFLSGRILSKDNANEAMNQTSRMSPALTDVAGQKAKAPKAVPQEVIIGNQQAAMPEVVVGKTAPKVAPQEVTIGNQQSAAMPEVVVGGTTPSVKTAVEAVPSKAVPSNIDETPLVKTKSNNASWSNFVKGERKKEGTNAAVFNMTDDPDVHQYFTRKNLTTLAKETSNNGTNIDSGFKKYVEDITNKLRPVMGDDFKIASAKDLRELRSSYMRMARSSSREQMSLKNGHLKIEKGPMDITGEADIKTIEYNKKNGLSENSMSIIHIDPQYKKTSPDSREDFKLIDYELGSYNGGYIPVGITAKGIKNTIAVKFEPQLVKTFDANPTKYLNAGESNLSEDDKFLRVYLTDVLGLDKTIEAADVVKRSNLLFNRYDMYSGKNPDKAVNLITLKAKTIKEIGSAADTNESMYLEGSEEAAKKSIDSLNSGTGLDGKFILGENVHKEAVDGFSYDPQTHKSGLKMVIDGTTDNGVKYLHKGHGIVADDAIKAMLKEEYGIDIGPYDIVSFDANAKLGLKSGNTTIQLKNLYGKSLAASEDGNINRSIENRFSALDEGITADMTKITDDNIKSLDEFTSKLSQTKSKEELLDLVTEYSEKFGLKVENIFESNLSDSFQLGAAKINLSRQMERLTKNLFFDTVLTNQAPESGRVFHTFPIKLEIDGPGTPKRYPKNDEIVMGEEFMQANNIKEGDEILAYRDPLIDINNIVIAKAINGSKLGNKSLGTEHAFMSPFNERIRQGADQDGDKLQILKAGDGGIPQSYINAVKKRGSKAIPFTEVNKIEGGTGYATSDNIKNVIKNQLAGDDQTGLIASQARIMDMVTENNATIVLRPAGKKTVYFVVINNQAVDKGIIKRPIKEELTIKPKWGNKERQLRTQALQEALDSKKSVDIIVRSENNNPNWIAKQLFSKGEEELSNKEASILKVALKNYQKPMNLSKIKNDFENLDEVKAYLKDSLEMYKKIKLAGGKLTPYQEKLLLIDKMSTFAVPQEVKVKADMAGTSAVSKTFGKPTTSKTEFPGLHAVRTKFLPMRTKYFKLNNLTPEEKNIKRKEMREEFLDWFNEELDNNKFTAADKRAIATWAASTKEANLSFVKKNEYPKFIFRLFEMINIDPAVARVYYKASESVDDVIPAIKETVKAPVTNASDQLEFTIGEPTNETTKQAVDSYKGGIYNFQKNVQKNIEKKTSLKAPTAKKSDGAGYPGPMDGKGFVGDMWKNFKEAAGVGVTYTRPKDTTSAIDTPLLKPESPHKLSGNLAKRLSGHWIGTNYDPLARNQNRPDATSTNLGQGAVAGLNITHGMAAVPRKPGSDEAMLRLGTVIKNPQTGELYMIGDLMNRRFDGMQKIDFATPGTGSTPSEKYNQNFSDWQIIRDGAGREDAREFVKSGQWDKLRAAMKQ